MKLFLLNVNTSTVCQWSRESAILDQAYTWLVSAFPIVQLCDAYTYSQIYFDWKH